MKKNIVLTIGIVIVLAGIIFLVSTPVDSPDSAEDTNHIETSETEEASIFNLNFEDYDGNPVNLANLKGTPLVINAWASWCPFCVKELPAFLDAQEEFGEQILFIGVNREELLSQAKSYTDGADLTDKLLFVLDPDDTFYRFIGGFSMPETVFVDANGLIKEHKRGPMELDEIRDKINKIL